jgi:hypothetical protein
MPEQTGALELQIALPADITPLKSVVYQVLDSNDALVGSGGVPIRSDAPPFTVSLTLRSPVQYRVALNITSTGPYCVDMSPPFDLVTHKTTKVALTVVCVAGPGGRTCPPEPVLAIPLPESARANVSNVVADTCTADYIATLNVINVSAGQTTTCKVDVTLHTGESLSSTVTFEFVEAACSGNAVARSATPFQSATADSGV